MGESVIDDNELENLEKMWKGLFKSHFQSKFITVKGVRFPEEYTKWIDVIENFKVRDDDVWVCSFPKSGTTWTQEMVWCLANDIDLEGAKINLSERFPFFELPAITDFSLLPKEFAEVDNEIDEGPEHCDNLPSPRFIKTHLPFHLLPRDLREGKNKAKIIYVRRNPKDTCISYYHHFQLMEGYQGNFDLFCKLFLADKLLYCPYWEHILGFWNSRDDSKMKILFLKFEDMKSNLSSVIQKTSEFLGKPSLLPGKLDILLDHLSFSKMKNNPAVNKEEWIGAMQQSNISTTREKFIRSGEVNQWKAVMSPEMSEKFDEWTVRHLESSEAIEMDLR